MARHVYEAKYDNSWGLVVGINEYEHARNLDHARSDADEVARVLIDQFRFPNENVTLLLDGDANLQSIRAAMYKIARESAADDRVFVFYAGHGVTIPAYGGEAGFLVPCDGRSQDAATLLPWDEFVRISQMVRAKHVLFIMDACYGGLIASRSLPPGSKRYVRDMLGRYTRQFLTAGKADERVADGGGPREGHSVFTGHLLDALEGDLAAEDGIISANAAMSYVYDRVSKAPMSKQTPHYGFIDGDGDFLFSYPDLDSEPEKPLPEGDYLIEIPADLNPQDVGGKAQSMLDQLKDYLSEERHRIRLHDLVMEQLRRSQQRLGEEHFSTQDGGRVSGEEFADRLLRYENAMSDLLQMSVLLGRWTGPSQQNVVQQLVNVLAGQIESRGGLVLWLALRSYPMLLAMYIAGIAALEGSNYCCLKTLFGTEVPDHTRSRSDSVTVVQATTIAMLDIARTDAFKLLPGHERHYTPQSEYLFKRVQPFIDDILFTGGRYEDLFDRFEILYALTYSDFSGRDWGHPGRFAWKYCSRMGDTDPFTSLVDEANREGQDWGPVKAGLFQGSPERFQEVAKRYKEGLLARLSWH